MLVNSHLRDINKAGPYQLCSIRKSYDMSGAVHGDDFTFLGYDEDLDTLKNLMKGWFDLKVRGRLGPDEGDDKEIIILGRHLEWGPTGISITADAKHADSMKKYCKIDDDSKRPWKSWKER